VQFIGIRLRVSAVRYMQLRSYVICGDSKRGWILPRSVTIVIFSINRNLHDAIRGAKILSVSRSHSLLLDRFVLKRAS
jgi:hypothetical protein